ncbi:hypothetical protein ABB02_00304 [Clostridiaceae bacterium JG1575]|nr:hypothetical protein ABB02_00304 [Clostridiaceae bacterium JG1575]
MEKAMIRVRTLLPGEDQFIELTTKGEMSPLGEELVIRYEESELTGMENTTTTITITMAPQKVIIERSGSFATQLEFVPHADLPCLYHTPYGTLQMVTQTKAIDFTREGLLWNLKLRYAMVIEGDPQSETRMEIDVWDEAGEGAPVS